MPRSRYTLTQSEFPEPVESMFPPTGNGWGPSLFRFNYNIKFEQPRKYAPQDLIVTCC